MKLSQPWALSGPQTCSRNPGGLLVFSKFSLAFKAALSSKAWLLDTTCERWARVLDDMLTGWPDPAGSLLLFEVTLHALRRLQGQVKAAFDFSAIRIWLGASTRLLFSGSVARYTERHQQDTASIEHGHQMTSPPTGRATSHSAKSAGGGAFRSH